MVRMQKLRIQFNFVAIAIFILTSLSFIRLVSSEESSSSTALNGGATIGQVIVLKPSNGRISVTPGSSVELIWQFTRKVVDDQDTGGVGNVGKFTTKKPKEESGQAEFFCGYRNKKGNFVLLAIDYNDEEFSIPSSHPEDDKDFLSRIKTSYAQNHDNGINERGFTISAVKTSDTGIFECGVQPKRGSGIVYQGRIHLEVKAQIETTKPEIEETEAKTKPPNTETTEESVISLTRKRQSMTIFGRSYPKWAVLAMVVLITFILILVVAGGVLFLRHRRRQKRRGEAEDREALLDVVSSDEDEVMEYQRQVDKQQQSK